jgi:hypothetical protein
MFLSKLINVISALDKPGYKRLQEFVSSPYFKIPQASVDLFEYLDSIYPNFPERKMSPEAMGKSYKNLSTRSKAAHAGSDLLKAIEYFLAIEDWQKQELRVSFHQYNALQRLELLDQYDAEYKKTYEKIEKDPEQDIETFFYRHIYTELSSTGFDALLNRTTRNDLSPTLKTLDEFYSIKLLRYMCEAVSRKQVLGVNYNEAQMDRVINILQPYTNSNYPYAYLFVNVYQMLKAETYEKGEPYYSVIKEFINAQTEDSLPPSCIESMSYAVNWCILWNSRGYEKAAHEYLWWVELKMKYGLLLENGKMLPITFRNILALTVTGHRTPDWMKRFIEQYGPYLPSDSRETNVAFAEGLYFYRTKQYTKAIQSFLTAQAKDEALFNAIIRRWQYMSYYEQSPDDTDLLLNQLHSFEKYIVRNQEEFHQFKGIFTIFIGYAKKMLEAGNRSKRLSLKQSLDGEPFFPGKVWLMENLK